MKKLRRFFDHLHAQQNLSKVRKPLLWGLVFSISLVILVAPLSLSLTCSLFLMTSLVLHYFSMSLPWFVVYPVAGVFLISFRFSLSGATGTTDFIAATFALLALAQSFRLREYWQGQLMCMWLVASNVSVLLLNQSATLFVWTLIALFLNFGQLLRLHVLNFSIHTLVSSLKSAARTTLYTLPMMILFVNIFERSQSKSLRVSSESVSGVSLELEPGKVSRLNLRRDAAYRVVLDRPIPEFVEKYWRVASLTNAFGLKWSYSPKKYEGEKTGRSVTPCQVSQRIYSRDSEARANFIALDSPIEGTYKSGNPMSVTSNFCETASSRVSKDELKASLEVKGPISNRVKALTERLKLKSLKPHALSNEILKYFVKENFLYTLEPKRLGFDGLDSFLFHTKEGYCEHFAGAYASLLRLSGVPARVVVGFHGGQYNSFGNYWIIAYQDAHAWAEFWDGVRWNRVDPTATVSPEFARQNRAPSSVFSKITSAPLFDDLGLFIDGVYFKVDELFKGRDKIISFDELTMDPYLALASLFLLLVVFQIQKTLRAPEQVLQDQFRALCLVLQNMGLRRDRTEGFDSFRLRVLTWVDGQKDAAPLRAVISRAFENYLRFRYGPNKLEKADIKAFSEEIRFAKQRLSRLRLWTRVRQIS